MMQNQNELGSMRKDYVHNTLNDADLTNEPYTLFTSWFLRAIETEPFEPNAMTLSTTSEDNHPSSRIVLLREYANDKYVFFSNYLSRKGIELNNNPHAALLFYWPKNERQIRLEGVVNKLSREQSQKYFQTRPKENRISTIISPQSNIIKSRHELEEKAQKLRQNMTDIELKTVPENWGGYCFTAHTIEFWQGRKGRLHDRIQYNRLNNHWIYHRLAP